MARVSEGVFPSPPGYELRTEIGRGGMGVVYRAHDHSMNREVAVKLLQDQFPADSITAHRFLEEARITGQLQHPGIPAVHQVGLLADGRPFLAMKLIKGQTLDQLVTDKAPINKLGVVEAIGQAVGYAHAHDIIHRDLKPANIMVGAFGEVQVMDWGLAKHVGTSSNRASGDPEATTAPTEIRTSREQDSETQAGSVLGTLAFMPPEQAIGAIDQIDARSDVFSLGAILCVLLTGKPPYVGESSEAVRQQAIYAKLEDAYARLDGCGAEPGLIALAKQCLTAEREKRPRNAQAVAQAVAALRTDAEERAKQAELDRAKAEVQVAEQRKRRRVLMLSGTAVFAVLVAGIAGTTLGLRQAQEARDAESKRADSEAAAKAEVEIRKQEIEATLVVVGQRTKLALDAFNQMVFGIQERLARIIHQS